MIAKLPLVYQYITDPKSALSELAQQRKKKDPSLSLALFSLVLVALANTAMTKDAPFVFGFTGQFILVASITVFQAVFQDYFAQLLGFKAQSYKLAKLLCLSLLPFTLALPFYLLANLVPTSASLLSVIGFCLAFGLSFYLEYLTIQYVYKASGTKCLLIFLFPVWSLPVLGLLVASVLVLSSLLTLG